MEVARIFSMMISDSGWISTADRLPDQGVDVLLCVLDRGLVVVGSLEQAAPEELYWESDSDEVAASPLSYVSHWMPLPPLPLA